MPATVCRIAAQLGISGAEIAPTAEALMRSIAGTLTGKAEQVEFRVDGSGG